MRKVKLLLNAENRTRRNSKIIGIQLNKVLHLVAKSEIKLTRLVTLRYNQKLFNMISLKTNSMLPYK